jgi:iron(III) transport system ATP-binding protein
MIKVVGLVKIFGEGRGAVRAVDQVHFEVAEGQLFTLLGPSGCGKTTTLRCIAGLEAPTAGEISIGGQLVFCATGGTFVPAHKRNIGMVFQSYAIWPHMTVFQNVAYPLKSRGFSRSQAKERALKALETVGLRELEDRPAPKLSGGQQQRVALARAIAGDPKILLLDEPLSNLDAKLREEMRAEIRNLQRRLKITSLYVTHDQIEALTISDQIAVMAAGRIVEVGTPREVYLRPKSRFAAHFVGLTNAIPGRKKEEGAEGSTVVEIPFGEIRCSMDHALPGEKKVLVLARPESLRVSRASPEAKENIWIGEVKEKIFVGDFIDCQISLDGFVVRAKLDPYTELVEGDKVYLYVDPRRCSVIGASEP